MDPHAIRLERVDVGGVELQVAVAGEGPVVVLLHGFPELAYSWRHQIRDLAAAGYRVIAPDMRGYGASDCPDDVDQYTIFHLVGDVVALLRRYSPNEGAVVVGHDWGAWIAWSLALMRPDLLAGVAGVSVPFAPHLDASIIDVLRERVGDGFHYILWFQEPGVADVELDADPIDTMRTLLWLASGDMEPPAVAAAATRTGFLAGPVPEGLPPWLHQGDLDAYSQAFLRTGFTGGLNWYRNLHRNWELMAPWRHMGVSTPALFIGGRQDPVLTGSGELDGAHPLLELQAQTVADLRVVLIEGAGHWTQQERPEATSAALLEFCGELLPASG